MVLKTCSINFKNSIIIVAVLTSVIRAYVLFCQTNVCLFVCVIGWKPEMSADGLHHSHVFDFVWKIWQVVEFCSFVAFLVDYKNYSKLID